MINLSNKQNLHKPYHPASLHHLTDAHAQCQEARRVYERSAMKEDNSVLLVYLLIRLWEGAQHLLSWPHTDGEICDQ